MSGAQLEQILPILEAQLLAVQLEVFRLEVGPDEVRPQVAGEAIGRQLERVDNAGENQRLARSTARSVLPNVQRRRENRREQLHRFWKPSDL